MCSPGSAAGRRSLPCKYFYDARGADLFDQITELDVYYPTRTEIAIMRCSRARDGVAHRATRAPRRARQREQHQDAHPSRPARRPRSLRAGRHLARLPRSRSARLWRATTLASRSCRSVRTTLGRSICHRARDPRAPPCTFLARPSATSNRPKRGNFSRWSPASAARGAAFSSASI